MRPLLALLALLSGCTAAGPPGMLDEQPSMILGHRMTPRMAAYMKLRPGMTVDAVEALLGVPDHIKLMRIEIVSGSVHHLEFWLFDETSDYVVFEERRLIRWHYDQLTAPAPPLQEAPDAGLLRT